MSDEIHGSSSDATTTQFMSEQQFDEFFNLILDFGERHGFAEPQLAYLLAHVAKAFELRQQGGLTPEEIHILLHTLNLGQGHFSASPDGDNWTVQELVKRGLMAPTGEHTFAVTEKGRAALGLTPRVVEAHTFGLPQDEAIDSP